MKAPFGNKSRCVGKTLAVAAGVALAWSNPSRSFPAERLCPSCPSARSTGVSREAALSGEANAGPAICRSSKSSCGVFAGDVAVAEADGPDGAGA